MGCLNEVDVFYSLNLTVARNRKIPADLMETHESDLYLRERPGAVARSEACSLGMQAAPSSIPTSGTFFHGDLVMKTFLWPFSLFR